MVRCSQKKPVHVFRENLLYRKTFLDSTSFGLKTIRQVSLYLCGAQRGQGGSIGTPTLVNVRSCTQGSRVGGIPWSSIFYGKLLFNRHARERMHGFGCSEQNISQLG